MRTELVEKPPPLFAWLAVLQGPNAGEAIRLGEQTRIGRDAQRNALRIPGTSASGEHAIVRLEERQFVLYDLGSLNGTLVNGQRVDRCVLVDGDRIRIGDTEIMFKRI